MPTSDWVLNYVAFAGCVPAPNGKPTISSQGSDPIRLGAPGAAISDTATLIGGRTPTGTVQFALYRPGDEDCSDAPVFTSTWWTVPPVNRNGDRYSALTASPESRPTQSPSPLHNSSM